MSRENTSPDPPGEDIFLTSSPCWQPQYTWPGHGCVSHFRGRFSESYSSRSSLRLHLRLQAAGWRLPTMVLSETRGLWLFWVVRGGIRCPVRLRLVRRGLNPAWILTLEPERSVAVGFRDNSALRRRPCAQAACSFTCSASNASPFFHIFSAMAAILRARVSRAISGCMLFFSSPR
jgi:hypothetical protein